MRVHGKAISVLNQGQAQEYDKWLMGDNVKYSIYQLMELAGQSVAHCIAANYPTSKFHHCLILCGPGNNGGDGLVAARHLAQMGYQLTAWYPAEMKKELYRELVAQCTAFGVAFVDAVNTLDGYDLVTDAMFGFGFQGEPREPYRAVLKLLVKPSIPVVCVDVPSGWPVDGEIAAADPSCLIRCDLLISLTLPKECAKRFKTPGKHFVGGRFIPETAQCPVKGLQYPEYEGLELFAEVTD